jgi:hypothetical protein
MPTTKPTPAQIKSVRRILYDPHRVRQMRDDASSISVLLNLENQNPSSTFSWYIPATGALAQEVVEAAQRCRRIATTLLSIRKDLAHVSVPETDRKHLMAALQAQAASWQARANAWAATGQPADTDTLVASISGHVRTALAQAQHVQPYLRKTV